MRSSRKFRRGLPTPMEVIFYLVAVIAFCVVNWLLLKAGDTQRPKVNKPIETLIVEEMLKDMTPVMKAETNLAPPGSSNFSLGRRHALELDRWMSDPATFLRYRMETELTVEDWMLSTESWLKD